MCLVTRLGQEHQLELFHLYQVVLTLGTGNVLMRLHESILSMPHATQSGAVLCSVNDVKARARA